MSKLDELHVLSARAELRRAKKGTPEHSQALREYINAVRVAREDPTYDGIGPTSPKALWRTLFAEAVAELVRNGARSCMDVSDIMVAKGIKTFYGGQITAHNVHDLNCRYIKDTEPYSSMFEFRLLRNRGEHGKYDKERTALRKRVLWHIKQGVEHGKTYEEIAASIEKKGIKRRDGKPYTKGDVACYVYRYMRRIKE